MRALRAVLALALVVPVLSGCGKKPTHLDPPEGAGPEASLYPRVYPNIKYDPAPAGAKPEGHSHPAAPAPVPVLEPMAPSQAYPTIIRPDTLAPTSALVSPGQGGGSQAPWSAAQPAWTVPPKNQ
jgi:hypothetical protein